MAGAAQVESDIQFAGNAAHHAGGDAKQTHLADLTVEVEPILLVGELLRSAAGSYDHAETPAFFDRQGRSVESSSPDCFGRRAKRQWQDARHVLAFLLFDPGKLIEVRNLASYLDLDGRWVEARDALDTAASGQRGFGKRPVTNPVRTNNSHSRDYAASFHHVWGGPALSEVERGSRPPPL